MSVKTIGHGAGYLLNDNRAAGEGKEEADVILCPHCQKVMTVQQWRDSTGNGWCMHCMAPCCVAGECGKAFAEKGCLPFIAQIERLIEHGYAKAQFRRVAGLEPEQPSLTLFRGPPTT
jgi:hypothetical protein